jgi:hypothetical protein
MMRPPTEAASFEAWRRIQARQLFWTNAQAFCCTALVRLCADFVAIATKSALGRPTSMSAFTESLGG